MTESQSPAISTLISQCEFGLLLLHKMFVCVEHVELLPSNTAEHFDDLINHTVGQGYSIPESHAVSRLTVVHATEPHFCWLVEAQLVMHGR